MIRLIASTIIHLLANALGLLIASFVLTGFSINWESFLTAIVIFTLIEVIAGPLVLKIAIKNVPALVGGIALVTTFIGLLVTNIITNGLVIHGLKTWIFATVIVWLCALLAGLLLPLFIFKSVLKKKSDAK